jgi:hypothetical protein
MQDVYVINCHIILQLSNRHYICHIIFYNTDFKMINITYMISILNSVFTIVFYVMNKARFHLHMF